MSDFIFQESNLLDECIPEVVTAQILPALKIFIKNGTIKKNQNVVLFFSSHAVNDRDNIKKLLLKFGHIEAWKKIRHLIPVINNKTTELKTTNSVYQKNIRFVPNDLYSIKKAVNKLLTT